MSENIGRYFLGSVVDPSNDFDFQAGRSFVAWTGFYKGEKKVFTFSKK